MSVEMYCAADLSVCMCRCVHVIYPLIVRERERGQVLSGMRRTYVCGQGPAAAAEAEAEAAAAIGLFLPLLIT